MLWKNSRLLGCAISRNKKGASFIVAKYYPRGNTFLPNAFAKNIGNITEVEKTSSVSSTTTQVFKASSPEKNIILSDSSTALPTSLYSIDAISEVNTTKLRDYSTIISATTSATDINSANTHFLSRTTSLPNYVTRKHNQTLSAVTQSTNFIDYTTSKKNYTINYTTIVSAPDKTILKTTSNYYNNYLKNYINSINIPTTTRVLEKNYEEINATATLNVTSIVSTVKNDSIEMNNTKVVVLFDDFSNECLFAHNNLRKIHGADDLQLNQELSFEAQE